MKFVNGDNLESIFLKIKNYLNDNYSTKQYVDGRTNIATQGEVEDAMADVFGSAEALNEEFITHAIDEILNNNDKE